MRNLICSPAIPYALLVAACGTQPASGANLEEDVQTEDSAHDGGVADASAAETDGASADSDVRPDLPEPCSQDPVSDLSALTPPWSPGAEPGFEVVADEGGFWLILPADDGINMLRFDGLVLGAQRTTVDELGANILTAEGAIGRGALAVVGVNATNQIVAAVVDATGTPLGPVYRLTATDPSLGGVVWNAAANEFAFAWTERAIGGRTSVVRIDGNDGAERETITLPDHGDVQTVDLAATTNGYAAAWTVFDGETEPVTSAAFIAIIESGLPARVLPLDTGATGSTPALRFDGEALTVAYAVASDNSQFQIVAERRNLDLSLIGEPLVFEGGVFPDATLDRGDVLVAMQVNDTPGIRVVRIRSGVVVGDIRLVDTPATNAMIPQIAVNSERLVLSWLAWDATDGARTYLHAWPNCR